MWSRWVALLSETETGTALALFRIALGICAFGTIATVVGHGITELIWFDVTDGGYRNLTKAPYLFAWIGGVTPSNVWAMIAVSLIASVFMTLGLGGRVTNLVVLQTVMALTDINSQTGGAYDQLITNALWLSVLGDTTATLSLDCKRRTGAWTSSTPVGRWVRWLILLQLVVMYFSTALQKVSAYWTPAKGYSALYYILQQPSWHRWDLSAAAYVYPLTQAATFGTWMFELSCPLILWAAWFRRAPERPGRLRRLFNRWDLRVPFALFGVSMHLGIMALMNVGPFTPVTLCFYVALLASSEWEGRLPRLAGA